MATIHSPFPTDRVELRRHLLAAVDRIAGVVAEARAQAEHDRTLAPAAVDAIAEAGLFKLKAPRDVGGAEADPVVQMDVIEAMALIDPAASWTMFIGSAVSGAALARLSDQAVGEILDRGFPVMAGSLKPGGSARRVEGGWVVTGRWGWGSGIPHADYVSVPVLGDEATPLVGVVVPVDQVTVLDTWHVLGMRGTGSHDYELDEVFVPDHFATDLVGAGPQRGGPLYRLGMPGFVINEHGAFAYALGRLALRTVIDAAIEKKRGYTSGVSLADREVVQRTISRGAQRMKASQLLMADVMDRMFAATVESGLPPAELQAEARAAATWCTDEAVELVSDLFRYVGGSAVMTGHPMEQILRDLYTVQSHLMVTDAAYEDHGKLLLGLTDRAPLG